MKDIFGKILLDIYKGKKKVKCIIERNDGYKDLSSSKEYFYPYTKWPRGERAVMKLVKGRVLDVGIGAGRHALYLQSRGFKVTGIDVSPGAIEVCKLRGIKDVRAMSMNNLRFKKEKFDTVIMMCNNFGLSGNFQGVRKFLKNVYKVTSKNAIIIASSINYSATTNRAHLEYQCKYRRKHRYGVSARIRNIYGREKGEWFNLYMIVPMESIELVKGTGWKVEKIIPSDWVNPKKLSYSYFYILKKK